MNAEIKSDGTGRTQLKKPPASGLKLRYGQTILIGLGFFSTSLLWSLYNSFVPLILRGFIESTTVIGLIMTIDNVFGVIFQPLFGSISDRTHTRIGKRMPFIIVGAPLCALLFMFIPRMNTLFGMMLVIIFFNFITSIWRAPMIALMPDFTPSPLWSKANGIINLMGGMASVLAFAAGGKIAEAYGRGAAFLMGGAVMMAAVLLLFLFVREKDNRLLPARDFSSGVNAAQLDATIAAETRHDVPRRKQARARREKSAQKPGGLASFKLLPPAQRRSLLFLLLAIFFWFCAYNAVETFFTSYAVEKLSLSDGQATVLLAFFSVAFVVFALPSGLIAGKTGRKRTIIAGLIGLVIVFIPMSFLENMLLLRGLLIIGGFFWACININSLPMVLELGTEEELGTFTGYYYFFSFGASIVSPILFGFIRDLTHNFGILFIYAPILFACALFCMLNVKHGEATGE